LRAQRSNLAPMEARLIEVAAAPPRRLAMTAEI
jgi:hypothetical protein